MDTLALHIEYLLSRHDCVILPGFGAFIASESEPSIDLSIGIISPRRRVVSFNASVVTDDGLLTHSIARRHHLDYEDARRKVLALVNKLRADLRSENEADLGLIGKLTADPDGLINFQPRVSITQSDILTNLHFNSIATERVSSPLAANPVPSPDGSRTVIVPHDRYVFTVSKRAVHAAAMLIMILTIGISLFIPANHDNQQKASVLSLDEFFRKPVSRIIDRPPYEETDSIISLQSSSASKNSPDN